MMTSPRSPRNFLAPESDSSVITPTLACSAMAIARDQEWMLILQRRRATEQLQRQTNLSEIQALELSCSETDSGFWTQQNVKYDLLFCFCLFAPFAC
jgi:hypothetical protein